VTHGDSPSGGQATRARLPSPSGADDM
jgi:hypothetical protein